MLDGLAAAAELEQPGADRGIVDLGEIAAQLLVGDAGGGGDGAQLIAEEPLIARPGVGRFGKAHILAGAQPLHGAGLEAGFDDAILVRLVLAHDGVLGVRRDDEAGKERRDLGLDQGGVVELVELVELDQRPGEPGLAPDLAGTERPEEMGDAVRRHPHQIVVARAHDRIAGMGAGQVVGGAAAEPVELDAGAHQVAARQCRVEGERHMLGLQELDLQAAPRARPRACAP